MPLLIGYFRSQVRTREPAWPYIYGAEGLFLRWDLSGMVVRRSRFPNFVIHTEGNFLTH